MLRYCSNEVVYYTCIYRFRSFFFWSSMISSISFHWSLLLVFFVSRTSLDVWINCRSTSPTPSDIWFWWHVLSTWQSNVFFLHYSNGYRPSDCIISPFLAAFLFYFLWILRLVFKSNKGLYVLSKSILSILCYIHISHLTLFLIHASIYS